MSRGKWQESHTKFFKLIMKYASHKKTEVIYLRGNHDDFLDEFVPFHFNNLFITHNYIHESCGKRYFIIHGDIFDSITTNLKWVSKLGSTIYSFLLWLNRNYNRYRTKRGLPYYSLSQKLKYMSKRVVSLLDDFENSLSNLAKEQHYDGIICGHIHQASDKMINGIHYLNSGDWVESMTAITEDFEGNWKIIHYNEWVIEFEKEK